MDGARKNRRQDKNTGTKSGNIPEKDAAIAAMRQANLLNPGPKIDTILGSTGVSKESTPPLGAASWWFKAGRIVGSQSIHLLKRLLLRVGTDQIYGGLDLLRDLFADLLPPYLISRENFIKRVGAWAILNDRRRYYGRMQHDFELVCEAESSSMMFRTSARFDNNNSDDPGNSSGKTISEQGLRVIFGWVLTDCVHLVCLREKPLHTHLVKILGDQVIKELRLVTYERQKAEQEEKNRKLALEKHTKSPEPKKAVTRKSMVASLTQRDMRDETDISPGRKGKEDEYDLCV